AACGRKAPMSERCQIRSRAYYAASSANKLMDDARDAFAAEHGWRYAPKLSRHHRDVFVFPKTRRVAAAVYHYHDDQGPPRVGDGWLPFSWYYPNRHDALLVLEEMKMTALLPDILASMQKAGFFVCQRKGLKPSLWRKTARGAAAVTACWLRDWINRNVDSNATLATAERVLLSDLTGFTVVTDESRVLS